MIYTLYLGDKIKLNQKEIIIINQKKRKWGKTSETICWINRKVESAEEQILVS